MFDDEEHERKMARNHLIAIILITALMMITFNWFMGAPQHTQPSPATPPGESLQDHGALPAEKPLESSTQDLAQSGDDSDLARLLPPVPQDVDPARDDVVIEDADLNLTITSIGARLKQTKVLLGKDGEDSQLLVPPPPVDVPDTQVVYPLGLRFADTSFGDAVNSRRWELVDKTGKSATFRLTVGNKAEITKRISLSEKPHVIQVDVGYKNLSNETQLLGLDQNPAFILYWGPDFVTDELTTMMPKKVIWRIGDVNDELAVAKLDAQRPTLIPNVEWVAAKSAYFAVAMKPDFSGASAYTFSTGSGYRFGLGVPSAKLAPSDQLATSFNVYAGPSHLKQLEEAWETLPSIQRFYGNDIMNWFSVFLLDILNWFYAHTFPNYGVAIILLTVLVRVAMFPLTIKQIKSMKRMQLLAPELEELKKKYGDDQQELNKKMMEMYRERGVSPLGGCLPLLVQMPIFFALYKMLSTAFELRGAEFMWWIDDLSRADHLFRLGLVNLPLFGSSLEYFNLLPILMALSMMASTHLMPMSGPMQNPQQKMILTFMPIIFSVFCYTLPSGLCLYILTSTLLGIAQQQVTQHINVDVSIEKKRPARKRQHFYSAAKARQRRREKEARQGSKRVDTQRMGGGTTPNVKTPRKGDKNVRGGTKDEVG